MMIRFRFFLLSSFCVFLSLPVFPQDRTEIKKEGLRTIFLEAESYFLFEEYEEAVGYYLQLHKAMPENSNITYKLGRCYLHDPYRKARSVSYLKKAVADISFDYKKSSFRETKAPVDAIFYLGDAYLVTNQFVLAEEAYQQFLKAADPEEYDLLLVKERIASVQRAEKQINDPVFIIEEPLGENINDRFAQNYPVVSGDGNSLVYSSELQFYDAVYYSRKVDGQWTAPINLIPMLRVDDLIYPTALNYDGTELYLYRSDQYDGNLYVSFLEDSTWSEPLPLNDNINTKYWESHASLSRDGQTLYFTSNRPGGYGELDIYKAKRLGKTEWGIPENLGGRINSRHNDDSPFISQDGKRLYFTSLGHNTMGGYDVFYALQDGNGNWEKPQNIGYPVNTTDDELFFCPGTNPYFGYMARFYPEHTYGLKDLYRVEIFNRHNPRPIMLSGTLNLEDELKEGTGELSVRVINPETNEIISEKTISDNQFTIETQSGPNKIIISGESIETFTKEMDIPVNLQEPTISITADLEKVHKGLFQKEVTEAPPRKETREAAKLEVPDRIDWTKDKPIELKFRVPKSSVLQATILIGDSIISQDEYFLEKSRFTYTMRPQEGMSEIHFKLTYPGGQVAEETIEVYYLPQTPTALSSQSEKMEMDTTLSSDDMNAILNRLINLSEGAIHGHLIELQSDSLIMSQIFSSEELYHRLLLEAGANLFTVDDVDSLFINYLNSLAGEYVLSRINLVNYPEIPENLGEGLPSAGKVLDRLTIDNRVSTDSYLVPLLIELVMDSQTTIEQVVKWASDYLTVDMKTELEHKYAAEYKTRDVLYPLFENLLENKEEDEKIALLNELFNRYFLQEYQNNLIKSAKDTLREYMENFSLAEMQDPDVDRLVASYFYAAKRDEIHLGELLDLFERVDKFIKQQDVGPEAPRQAPSIHGLDDRKIIIFTLVGGFVILLFIILFFRKKRKNND